LTSQVNCDNIFIQQLERKTNMSPEQAQELLERLNIVEAENKALKEQAQANALKMKVSQKGAISVYGMGRFPVTLYAQQWQRIDSVWPSR